MGDWMRLSFRDGAQKMWRQCGRLVVCDGMLTSETPRARKALISSSLASGQARGEAEARAAREMMRVRRYMAGRALWESDGEVRLLLGIELWKDGKSGRCLTIL